MLYHQNGIKCSTPQTVSNALIKCFIIKAGSNAFCIKVKQVYSYKIGSTIITIYYCKFLELSLYIEIILYTDLRSTGLCLFHVHKTLILSNVIETGLYYGLLVI